MSLAYILSQSGDKIGLNPSVTGDRNVLLRLVNEVTYDLWTTSDMAGCLAEQYFKINSNQTISLPDYVGELRAMREADSHIAIKLSQMRPRYNQYNWSEEWRAWRLKGKTALQQSIHNQGPVTLTVSTIENPPVVVNIMGTSVNSSTISESITMSSLSVTSVNSYTNIRAFTKPSRNEFNITMLDMDGNQISLLSNDKLTAQYQEVDISTAPWYPPNVSSLLGWVEVLFKWAWYPMSDDNDEFIVQGYDNVIVAKMLSLYYEEQGNVQLALAQEQKAISLLAKIHENVNRGTDDTVAFVSNPHFDMQHRVGYGRDWRYAWMIKGR